VVLIGDLWSRSVPILFISNVLHPFNNFAVERLLNGDMSHRGHRRSAVPMLFTGREPDYITWPDFLDRAATTLNPPKAGRDDQRLTEWMCMPGGAGTGSNVTLAPRTRAGSGASNSGSMRNVPVKYAGGPLPERCEPLLLISIFSISHLRDFLPLNSSFCLLGSPGTKNFPVHLIALKAKPLILFGLVTVAAFATTASRQNASPSGTQPPKQNQKPASVHISPKPTAIPSRAPTKNVVSREKRRQACELRRGTRSLNAILPKNFLAALVECIAATILHALEQRLH
jgi:hypothetical protein